VEATVVVTDRDRGPDLATDLNADHIRLDQGAAGQPAGPRIGAECRDNDRTRMRRHHRQHVVEVESVTERPIDQRRHLWRRCSPTAQDWAHTTLASLLNITQQRRRDLAAGASEHDRERVSNRFLRLVEGLRRQVV
jgi:hypothetical protein